MAKSDVELIESKLIRELRKDNAKLRREIQQYRKKLSNIEHQMVDSQYADEPEDVINHEPKKQNPSCPHCNAKDVYIMTLRNIKYFNCHECERRGRYYQTK